MDYIEVWLRAQLAEDERVARAATPGKWQWATLAGKPNLALVAGTWPGQTVVPSASPDVYPNRYDAEHIALYDPDRMLAEIAAKRAILDLEAGRWVWRDNARHDAFEMGGGLGNDMVQVTTGGLTELITREEFRDRYLVPAPPSVILRHLAAPYADRTGYLPEWAA